MVHAADRPAVAPRVPVVDIVHGRRVEDRGPVPAGEVASGLAAMAHDVADHGDQPIQPPAADLLVRCQSGGRR